MKRLWMVGLLALCVMTSCGDDEPKSSTDILTDGDVGFGDTDRFCGGDVCSDAEACCASVCVDLEDDAENCGACGVTCGASEVCSAGVCRCGGEVCDQGSLCCGAAVGCVEADRDPRHCGGCGVSCAATESCSAGLCLCDGPGGVPEQCSNGAACCPGSGCVELGTDPLNCGGCGVTCGGGEICAGGVCRCGEGAACAEGELCCGETPTCMAEDAPQCQCGETACGAGEGCCEVSEVEQCTPTSQNEDNCGGCGVSCDVREACVGGSCRCFRGFADCDGDALNGCEARLNAEFGNCGACGLSCEPGDVCDGLGQCATRCQVGLSNCQGSCYNLQTNNQNCGGCGIACAPGELCSSGACVTTCQIGLANCTGDCVSTFEDRRHCGGCGLACEAGRVCSGGFCALSCEEGLTNCAGNCVDPRSNRAHCGGCGLACEAGSVCSQGTCVTTCQEGLSDCGGACVNTNNSRAHCGGCGDPCGPGELCVGGSCQVNCPPGFAVCAGKCVDLSEHRFHCGGCGMACEDFEVCAQGVCEAACREGLTACGDRCVDLSSDSANCGACGAACDAGLVCGDGVCGSECSEGLTLCGASCFDLDTSPFHCGACDAFCGAPRQACSGGACGCEEGFAECDGDAATVCEAALERDDENCGGCGVSCSSGEVCRAGACASALVKVVSDLRHGCALRSDGQLFCYGDGSSGQLGLGISGYGVERLEPTPVVGLTEAVVDVDVGARGTAAVLTSGALAFWGQLSERALPQASPTLAPGVSDAVQAAVGAQHVCYLRRSGSINCFGEARLGQHGDGELDGRNISTVSGIANAVAVASGGDTSCAITDAGDAACWGDGSTGLLGPGWTPSDPSMDFSSVPVPITGVVDAIAISMGPSVACVVSRSGSLRCWGDGFDVAALDPRSLTDVVQVAVGARHICAILSRGALVCMGASDFGQLGDGGLDPRPAPELVEGVEAIDVHASATGTCAVTGDGGASCWGFDGFSGLGSGVSRESAAPVAVGGVGGATDLATYGGRLCAATSSGVLCWAMTLDATSTYGVTPAAVEPAGLEGEAVVMGDGFLCALQSDTTVACVGAGGKGQLGDGALADSDTPVTVLNGLDDTALTGVTRLAASSRAVCAVVDDGTDTQAFCWGSGTSLGHTLPSFGVTQAKALPVLVAEADAALTTVTDVAVGESHICLALAGNTAVCFGEGRLLGDGVLSALDYPGDGSTVNTLEVSTGDLELFAFGGATCARFDSAGRAQCWGDFGQQTCKFCAFDDPSVVNDAYTAAPTDVPDVTGVAEIAIAYTHRCALLDTGAGACWGDNSELQLGLTDGSVFVASPVALSGISDAVEIITARSPVFGGITCARTSAGDVSCLGSNRGGALGDAAHLITTPAPLDFPF